jgi:hypothetical protein
MFTAPQITATAIVPSPALDGTDKRGSLPYTPLYEVCYTGKSKPVITTDGTIDSTKQFKSKRYIGVTLSETLNETGVGACTAQLSGSTIVRLRPSDSEIETIASAGTNEFNAPLFKSTTPLKFGDILYGTKDGYVTSSPVNQGISVKFKPTNLRTDLDNVGNTHAENTAEFFTNTYSDLGLAAIQDESQYPFSLTANVIPVGRFISHMGKVGGHDYVNMLICRNPLRRVPTNDGDKGLNDAKDAIWYEHPWSNNELCDANKLDKELGWHTPVPVLGQVRESKKATLCSTSHLAFLSNRLFRSCAGIPGTNGRKSTFYSELPFAPATKENKFMTGCVAPESKSGLTVPVVW